MLQGLDRRDKLHFGYRVDGCILQEGYKIVRCSSEKGKTHTGKPFSVRSPRIRLTSRGIRVTRPSVSIGGKGARINISSRGISEAVSTSSVSYNTRRGLMVNVFAWLFGRDKK